MTVRLLSAFLFALLLSAQPADAQFWDKVKEAAERGAERAAERETAERADKAVTGLFEAGDDAVACVVGDDTCVEQAREEGKEVVLVDEDGEPLPAGEQPAGTSASTLAEAAVPGSVHANYDFEPGERTLFADDFSSDNVGDFPRRLVLAKGNWEVVDQQGQRFLRNLGPSHSAVEVPLSETLPKRFTLAFDAHFPHGNQELAVATTEPENGRVANFEDQNYLSFGNNRSGLAVRGDGVEALQATDDVFVESVVPVRVMADGSYVKVYVGAQRVANVPNATLERGDVIWIENTYFADADHPMYIGNLRIAAGGRDLYDALESEGRVAVQDILFATGEATIQPASAEVLQEIATLLTEHADLRLLVEGHTDDEGSFESNMTLSKARAEAVCAYLVETHGIDGSRLKAIGLGQTQPAASNDSEAGRAENRRVELVKM